MKIDYFRNYFLQKRKELLLVSEKENKVIDIGSGADEVEFAQGLVMSTISETLSQRDKISLKKINEALLRIEKGNFGICEECGEEIAEKRLMVIPYCNTCISCAEYQEKLAKDFRKV